MKITSNWNKCLAKFFYASVHQLSAVTFHETELSQMVQNSFLKLKYVWMLDIVWTDGATKTL